MPLTKTTSNNTDPLASTSQATPFTDSHNDFSAPEAFCLRWNNYQPNMLNVFEQSFHDEKFVDCTLMCESTFIKAHKMVLSACSPYFQQIFDTVPCPHPVIVLKDMLLKELKPILEFMYKGEIRVAKNEIGPFLRVAESLKVRGLAENIDDNVTDSTLRVPKTAKILAQTKLDDDQVPAQQSTKKLNRMSKRKGEMSSSESLEIEKVEVPTAKKSRNSKCLKKKQRKQSFQPDDTSIDDSTFDDGYQLDFDNFKEEPMSDTSSVVETKVSG